MATTDILSYGYIVNILILVNDIALYKKKDKKIGHFNTCLGKLNRRSVLFIDLPVLCF